MQTLALWHQEQPLPHEHLHRGQTQHPLALSPANRTQCRGHVHPQYKDISCLFLVPIKFLQRKMHFRLRVFSLIFVLHTTPSRTDAELLLEGGEPKLNVLEVSTRCWQNHSKVTSKLRSLWYSDCSSKKHSGDREQGDGRRGGRKGMGEFVQVSSAVETEKGWGGLHRRRESPPLGSESLADR